MTKILIVISIVFLNLGCLKAQNFEILADSAHPGFVYTLPYELIAKKGNIEGLAKFYNLSTNPEDTSFTWKRTIKSAPDQWTFTVCDVGNCWLPNVDSNTFKLDIGNNYLFDVNAYPKSMFGGGSPQPGTAQVEIRIYPANKPNLAKTYTYFYNLAQPAGVSNMAQLSAISVFPNPATSVLNISTESLPQANLTYSIENIMGTTIIQATEAITSQNNMVSIDLANLTEGLYYINLIQNDIVVARQRFVKK